MLELLLLIPVVIGVVMLIGFIGPHHRPRCRHCDPDQSTEEQR